MGFVHRDLAARNILLTHNLAVKIADFGLCRRTDEEVYVMQREAKLPLKWTAPEALSKQQFSQKSDVWSFGVVLYEIFSAGEAPYADLSPAEVVERVQSGYRMDQPDLCPPDVYQSMLECWEARPEARPTFEELQHYYSKSLEHHRSEYGYISVGAVDTT